MAERRQQSIVPAIIVLLMGMLLFSVNFTSDVNMILLVILLRGKWLTICAALVIVLNVLFILPNLEGYPPVSTHVTELKVGTLSTLTRTSNVNDIISFLSREDLDLLCLQEVSKMDQISLRTLVEPRYQNIISNANNQVTLSRFPLRVLEDAGPYLVLGMTHPNWGEVEVVNVHLPRPYLSNHLAPIWQRFFSSIDHAKPTILCGDFNVTPNNSLYEVLRFQYQFEDALKEGYGFTFPNAQRRIAVFGPLIRIDYLFLRGLNAHKTRTVNASSLSDHRAVVSTIHLNN